MNMISKIFGLALLFGSILSISDLTSVETNSPSLQSLYETDPFYKQLLDRMRACVDYNQFKDESVHLLFDQLELSQHASENETNPAKFLYAQRCIEHVLCCSQILGEITQFTGVLHVPMPATPLCVNWDVPAFNELLDASIADDQEKLLTLRSPIQMLRNYLEYGGVLFMTYPKTGFEKRTLEQRNYYLTNVSQYPHTLIDTPLDNISMDLDLMGATYAFKHDNQWYVFSMKMPLTATSKEEAEWAFWFGKLSQPVIQVRANAICDYLIKNQGPNLKQYILKGMR